ncbi:hypothetical protein ACFQY5_23745 [Paeniroseomonas aquatica]|uniref:hypothetical protein n=1 Tax=Paeniroseomonas aquatica TaxID=373043 RepID=UPI00360749A2
MSDTGIGMAAADIPRAFEAFTQWIHRSPAASPARGSAYICPGRWRRPRGPR